MDCPGCGFETAAEQYEGNYGRTLEIDVCHACNGLWFDGRESLMLSPGATLRLFGSMHQRQESARRPLQPSLPCPRCRGILVETFDVQRGTRFSYFRCEAHGRFITFFQFLREKNLVRQATPKQLEELKARVRVIHCSNCGAPIPLDETAVCLHCRAPVCMLSPDSLEKTLTELKAAEVERTQVDPTAAVRLLEDRLHVDRLFRELNGGNPVAPQSASWELDLVGAGVRVLFGAVEALFKR